MSQRGYFGSTRFSVFDSEFGGLRASRDLDADSYREHLYSEARLSLRFDLFERFWLPALQAAIGSHDVRHLIFYSEELPEDWKARLLSLELPHVIQLIPVGNFREMTTIQSQVRIEMLGHYEVMGVYRLDDDDIIGPHFFDNLDFHVTPETVGFSISLSRGISAKYSEGGFWSAKDTFSPFIAIGLTSVMSAKHKALPKLEIRPRNLSPGHKGTAMTMPTVVDGRYLNWIRVLSDSQDTGVGGPPERISRYLQRLPALDLEFVEECGFGHLHINTQQEPS